MLIRRKRSSAASTRIASRFSETSRTISPRWRSCSETCDFEPAPGLCRLHLWSCLGGADARLACSAAQVSSTSIASPRASSTKPAEIAARQALAAALLALGAPVGPGETCSPRYELTLGVGQKPLKLKTKALFGTKTDSDQLQLTCTP